MIDSDDKHALGVAATWIVGCVVAMVTIAAGLGLSVRVFEAVAGI